MNPFGLFKRTEKDKLLKKLKEAVKIRDKMSYGVYKEIFSKECYKVGTMCYEAGATKEEINRIMGEGN